MEENKCEICDGSGSYGVPYLDQLGNEQVEQVQCWHCDDYLRTLDKQKQLKDEN